MFGRRWRAPVLAAMLLTAATACSTSPTDPFGVPISAPTSQVATQVPDDGTVTVTPTPTPSRAQPSIPVVRGPAGFGTRRTEVTVWLQRRLVALHYRPGRQDGVSDASTAAALRAFQTCQGLPARGLLDTATRKALLAPKPCRTVVAPRRVVAPKKAVTPGKVVTPSRGTGGHVVYLTFDDGPDPTWTPRVLSLLARHHATATFFVIGENVAAHPLLVRKEHLIGHAVGNHTWDHADLTHGNQAAYVSEVGRASQAIAAAGGGNARCLRPPYGATDAAVEGWTRQTGLREQLWTVDPRDWSRPGVAAITARVLGAVRPGSVVLMHDGGGDRAETVAALDTILTRLHQAGYTFAALPC